ncbi:adenylyl-sulfate kinase [Serinicoccus kebangsaanensis]|uniref:adenylyl-sulfate kinase n=1 Tax=Serinicoccus kebangsaanensis TaxID=2602069 RepID=UPI00124DFA21|nr:adenylyl-sulfate kinase [Serinicoccus kebangsaanensis]
MTPPSPAAPVFPGVPVLDDLELARLGLLDLDAVELPTGPATVVDAEGVPVAEVDETGAVGWLSPRSSRPFERLHLTGAEIERPAALVDSSDALEAVPDGTRTVVVLASTDGDDNQRDLDLVRTARRAAQQHGYAVRVAPVGLAAPGREQRVEQLARALAGETGTVHDLTAHGGPAAYPERGVVVLLTGLSGSGKSTLARALRDRLVEDEARAVSLLDGDVVRRHLSAGLGFSPEDRETNIRRIGWVAAEIARHGGIAIASPIAPFQRTRDDVRAMVEGRGGRFVLVHVATPLEECERRDRKGLYARARAGEIPDFTGISSPYEVPDDATLTLDTTGQDVDPLVDQILAALALPNDPPTPSDPEEE